MITHKYAGELVAGDEIAIMPGMLPPTVVQEVREVVEPSGESNPDLVKIVLPTDTANPDDAFDWPRETVFTVTYNSQATTAPAEV